MQSMMHLNKGKIMRKILLGLLIVLTGIFLIYTSFVYACENGHGSQGHISFDPADENIWSRK